MNNDERYVQNMLQRADRILADVDEAYIVQERGFASRPMPTFRPEEISLGKVLGKGGFGIVHEIKGFCLDEEVVADSDQPADEQQQDDSHVHYEIQHARQLMKRKAHNQKGSARYALKILHGDLTKVEHTRGMIDLALEAKYLSIVWHPNIIKLRGYAKGKLVDPDFFIILDRLYETLDQRLNHWIKESKHNQGSLFGIGKRKNVLHDLLVERMTIAYDLAAAFMYLHENRLVYRDIKPENIGFDLRGDVKVFDFGLCKTLSPRLKVRSGYGYRLTGRAGSLPYMAPEVAKMEPYDTKCDCFSFAILLWEMLMLKPAFKGMTPSDFMEKVVLQSERLTVDKHLPPLTRLMIPEAWDKDPTARPDMKRIAIIIRADLNDMTTDERVLRRTKHMNNRSNHSFGAEDDG